MQSKPTILYVGLLWDGGTCGARMQAIRQLGWQVLPVDTTELDRSGAWLERQLAQRFSVGPVVTRINELLLKAARTAGRRIDMIWIDKGIWILPDTLLTLKAETSAMLVHYTADPQVVFQPEKLRHFLASIPIYDMLFTTKPFEFDAYARHGAKNVKLVHQSYDERRLYPRSPCAADRQRLGSEVSFIGQYTPHYARLLQAAAGGGAQIRVWGPNWRKKLWRHGWMRHLLSGDGLWGEDYAVALSAAQIALCFLSKRYPETTTTRTFEIPGCATFMLAERTAAHLDLFEEGVEAEYFDTELELADKIRFYMRNPRVRQRIAEAGYARCIRSGYGNQARMQSLLAMAWALKSDGAAAAA